MSKISIAALDLNRFRCSGSLILGQVEWQVLYRIYLHILIYFLMWLFVRWNSINITHQQQSAVNNITMKPQFFLLMFFVASLTMFSCEKEGPIGPRGEQGLQGPQGAQGPQGPQGVPGNANVSRYQYSIPINSFTQYNGTNEWWAIRTMNASPVRGPSDIILGFVWRDHSGVWEWMALPLTDYFNTGDCFNVYNYSFPDGSSNRILFSIRNSCTSNGAPFSNMNSTNELFYRVFLIRGMPGIRILDEIDVTNYEEVNAAFGFED